jgi:hypothetical protein
MLLLLSSRFAQQLEVIEACGVSEEREDQRSAPRTNHSIPITIANVARNVPTRLITT